MSAGAPILAFDLGATNLRCGLVDVHGAILGKESIPTPQGDALAQAMTDLARRVRGSTDVPYVVAGIPGRVDYERGSLGWGRGQPPGWREVLDESVLARLLGLPVALANDADLAAVGEARFGAGIGHRDVAFLTISSGVGAGALVDGRLFRSRAKLGEIGLTVLALPDDSSEAPTLLEDLASGRGLEAAARQAGLPGSAEAVVAATRSGDPGAKALWSTYVRAVAAAVVNIAHLLLPEVVVIGGGVSRAGEILLDPVRDWLARYGPQGLPQPIKIDVAALGDDAGLAGAAAWRSVTDPAGLDA
jgi:glucokinase